MSLKDQHVSRQSMPLFHVCPLFKACLTRSLFEEGRDESVSIHILSVSKYLADLFHLLYLQEKNLTTVAYCCPEATNQN